VHVCIDTHICVIVVYIDARKGKPNYKVCIATRMGEPNYKVCAIVERDNGKF